MEGSPQRVDALEAPYEMSNLRPADTGLPMVIWVSVKGGARHGPRIKVAREHGATINPFDTVSVTIEDEPRVIGGTLSAHDMERVKQYIALNRDVLLQYWNHEMSTAELIQGLKSL